jgi:hypothetical protein
VVTQGFLAPVFTRGYERKNVLMKPHVMFLQKIKKQGGR